MIDFAHLKRVMERGSCTWYAPERLLCIDTALLLQLDEADYNALVEWRIETRSDYYDAVETLSRLWHRKWRKGVMVREVTRFTRSRWRLSGPDVTVYVNPYYARAFKGFEGLRLWISGTRKPVQIRDEADELLGLLMGCEPPLGESE